MRLQITEAYDGMTVKQLMRGELKLSTKMQKHLKYTDRGICVNGETVTVRKVLRMGDALELAIEDSESSQSLRPVELPLDILYEDEELVVPSKPANMPTHPSHDHYEDTVANALAYRYLVAGTPFVFRPINRLDRNTSGLLLVARNRVAAGTLTRAMQENQIEKFYLAVTIGELREKQGCIDAPLHRTAASIIVREVCPPDAPDAQEARTCYRVLAATHEASLVLVRPITGRTHQIRVHMASVGHPLLGDDLYGTPSEEIGRHALHAVMLSFPHPKTEERITALSRPPKDLFDVCQTHFPDFRWEALEAAIEDMKKGACR